MLLNSNCSSILRLRVFEDINIYAYAYIVLSTNVVTHALSFKRRADWTLIPPAGELTHTPWVKYQAYTYKIN